MSQISFSDFEYAGQRKQTRHEPSFVEMGQAEFCRSDLLKLIGPHCLTAGDGCKGRSQPPLVGQTAPRPRTDSKLSRRILIDKAKRKIECANPQVQAMNIHFQVIKQKHPPLTRRAYRTCGHLKDSE
ncbi:hypothetical protein J3D48_006352 [Pseudomonas fluorescens]|uniref:hypothetical protein n=1 Tax=Pseudomonas fluorescens TaxID=294 RepID=UPI00209F1B44|nr:hypothetical protein [Pseudomonas fluorescens]MCP1489942.1 hypothetical protein [Pseudomonas fluorescens]